MDKICSKLITKSKIQLIRSLKNKKYRYNNALFVVEGEKWVREIVKEKVPVDSIYTSDETLFNFIRDRLSNKDEAFLVKQKEIDLISSLKTASKSIAVLPFLNLKANQQEKIVMACESIRDPGNLGTIIRIADWFAIDKIVLSEDCVDIYNNKVVQATMGSLLRVPIQSADLENYLRNENSNPIYATNLNGESIHKIERPKNGIFVIGNEGKGISDTLMQMADKTIKIPRYGKAESLNAAIATGIICNWIRG